MTKPSCPTCNQTMISQYYRERETKVMKKISDRFYCESCDLVMYAEQLPNPETLKYELKKFMRHNCILDIMYYDEEEDKYALNLITHSMLRFPYYEYILKSENLNLLSNSAHQFHNLLTELGMEILSELGISTSNLLQNPQFSYRTSQLW